MIFGHLLIFFGLYLYISETTGEDANPTAYCFQFTWLGPMIDDENKIKNNCLEHLEQPCVEPFIITNDSTFPDLDYAWKNVYLEVACPLRPGYVCIKSTYSYNNAVINSTHFCGKMIEDKTTPILSGCYSQKIDGYTTESCACQSEVGKTPCNSAKITQYSYVFLLLIFLTQII